MSRWVPILLMAALYPLTAANQEPQTPPVKPGELQKERQTSGKRAVPPEEDKSYLREEHSFNPLQSQKSVSTGDFYFKKGKLQAAANRYEEATMWNDGNTEAWLKWAKAAERMKDAAAAKAAYSKYLNLVPGAKDAAEIRKKIDRLK
jgi:tetratricopeptide (TPR) repeat protein